MGVCFTLYVSPVVNWQPVQGVTQLSPNVSLDPAQAKQLQIKDGLMGVIEVMSCAICSF